jgi:group I intron endonuclease
MDIDKETFIIENRKKSGIYLIRNNLNGKIYVGSSTDITRRFYMYYSLYHISIRKNSLICRALLKYGYSRFSVEILEYCDHSVLIEREQYYIDLLLPEYNILKVAGSSMGYKLSEYTKAKISQSKLGVIRLNI